MPRARSDRAPRTTQTEGRALADLEAIVARVDVLYAHSSCPSSTECCRFGLTGREPFVTSTELALVLRGVRRRGGALAGARKALPLASDVRRDERTCPLLDRSGRCSVYASRPFGCRTFFCERATHERRVAHGEVGALVRELQEVGARHAPGGDVGRPLVRALEQALASAPGRPRRG